ncbi:hypothetical protein [Nocardioides ferulae]|uniref:hypothetical protein n=1 Tax=Nocardioides ferulae TaxID=2340821 RepID=UPI000EAF49A4|nr:hypothetical protein [Nocardioides ferulae]
MTNDEWRRLAAIQDGVIARAQLLESGLAEHGVRRLVRRRELTVLHPGVYVVHTGQPTWSQRAWAAVLHAAPAALAGWSALRAAEGPGRPGPERTIVVAVAHGRKVRPPPGVRVVRQAGLSARVLWNASPPRLRYEEAVLDVVAECHPDLYGVGVLARAVQERRTTPERLLATLADRARIARRGWLVAVLADLRDGTTSVLEHGYLTLVERPHGLPRARRQAVEVDGRGRVVYRDADYGVLLVELDGALFHSGAAARDADLERDLDAALTGRDTVRLGWGQVFDRSCQTAAKVGDLLQARGWRGAVRPCGPRCAVAAVGVAV